MKDLKTYLEEEVSSLQKKIDALDKTCKEYMSQYQANLGAKLMVENILKEKRKELENINK
jgi:hypothetical protein